jgi:hypothetical protein
MASDLVDTCTAVAEFIDALINLPTSPPSLYINVEVFTHHLVSAHSS